jgi:glycosyltransferase involved in cell wall biosynthesis
MILPLITCLCVSKNRPEFLKKAIGHFNAQTYENKNLVIVCECEDKFLLETISSNKKIAFIKLGQGSKLSLGERRNLAMQNCNGEYFCHWDDDDWYHIRRLELQMNRLTTGGKPACVLSRLILYDGLTNCAYLSSQRYWEGTLLCRTDLVRGVMRYPDVNKGEDHSLVVRLAANDHVYALPLPHLYAYHFHGNNTWDSSHFNQLFQAGYKLDRKSSTVLANVFAGKYDGVEGSQRVEKINFDVLPPFFQHLY